MARIGHVHIKVSNIKKSWKFYEALGFKISEKAANYIFLTFGKEHHDLALQEVPNEEHPSENMTGLYHFAIGLDNLKQLAEIYFKLKKRKIQFTPVDHGISKAIYLSDPDENGIEIYVDTRKERKEWHGMSKFI